MNDIQRRTLKSLQQLVASLRLTLDDTENQLESLVREIAIEDIRDSKITSALEAAINRRAERDQRPRGGYIYEGPPIKATFDDGQTIVGTRIHPGSVMSAIRDEWDKPATTIDRDTLGIKTAVGAMYNRRVHTPFKPGCV